MLVSTFIWFPRQDSLIDETEVWFRLVSICLFRMSRKHGCCEGTPDILSAL